ncbi:MAG: hydroxymethylpyrimidine/phosphomethylpyrimidine kinase [Deltaproteobacteria bacterium]|nr:hydroxymethylpyrimidine/phosphomethylpyrimidine kinase [Deltaproteobacteria bacterium]
MPGPAARRADRPPVLVVAGLDPSGGAGLAADLEALAAVGARGLPVAAALTAQGPRGARASEPVSPAFLRAQVSALLAGAGRRDLPRAVKTGMLGTAENAAALTRLLSRGPLSRVPLVVDPVLAATSGLPLLRGLVARAALGPLLTRAALLTPNLPELAQLTGLPVATDEQAVAAARSLRCPAVLVKGGHRRGAPVDLLVTAGRVWRFEGHRRKGTARGTGCRLASAIAGLVARGASLPEAVRGAREVVERYLDEAHR